MLSFFKKRSSLVGTSDSAAALQPSTSRPGLKPLHLVDKLLAVKTIDPLQDPRPSPIFRKLKQKSKPRLSSESPSAAPRGKASRPSLPSQSVTLSKRAPFVVPLHFYGSKAPRLSVPSVRATLHHNVYKTTASRPGPSSKSDVVPKPDTPATGRIPKLRAGSSVQRPKVMVKHTTKSVTGSRIPVRVRRVSADVLTPVLFVLPPRTTQPVRIAQPVCISRSGGSRIPVFVGRHLVNPSTPAPTLRSAHTPRFTHSLIPRLKYSSSPSSDSSDSGSIISFSLPTTPCPSPTQVVDARQSAHKVIKAAEVSAMAQVGACAVEDGDAFKNFTVAIDATPTPMQVSNSVSLEQISSPCETMQGPASEQPEDGSQEITRDVKADSDSVMATAAHLVNSGRVQEVAPAEDAKPHETATTVGVMGAFMGELETRYTWVKKLNLATANSRSPTKDAFVNKSECRRSAKEAQENLEVSSELQQALARRTSAISQLSSKLDVKTGPKEQRRPLAPIPSFVNTIFNGRRDPALAPTESVSTCDLTRASAQKPTITRSQGPPSNDDDSNPPGADFMVTELVTTAFGTRRVRRMVIPQLLEGSLPSRDPRIIMELNSLRAQQKVGGVASKPNGQV
ncbi:hypothetical protein B0H19DRAFT_1297444 [Mycena capillaripes]|nr:hypothetical protein B0H19DRAFT_1297444 [Mycena capillaripes]